MNTNSTQTSKSIFSEKYFCGIDLASKVIQVSVTKPGEGSFDKALSKDEFTKFIKANNPEDYIYGMEACGDSNYWAELINTLCNDKAFIFPAKKCRSYNHGCKDDRGDARGVRDLLLTYFLSPDASTIHPCVIRDRQNRADMALLKSYGDNQSDITRNVRRLIAFLKEQDATLCYSYSMSPESTIKAATEYIKKLNKEEAQNNSFLISDIQTQSAIIAMLLKRRSNILMGFLKYFESHSECQYFMAIPGVGLLLAVGTHIITQGDFTRFKNARSFAAYTGFTPAHSGTGGKNKIAHMSDNGNPVLKALIYEGANACTILQKHKNKKDKRVKISYGRHIAIDLWKIGINLKNPDIKEIVSHYDAELASKITEKNTSTKLCKFKSKCNKANKTFERLSSTPAVTSWCQNNLLEQHKQDSALSPYLAEFKNKNQLIDLSDPEGPFRRQSATLVAYLVEHNEVRELEINDLERLDLAEW